MVQFRSTRTRLAAGFAEDEAAVLPVVRAASLAVAVLVLVATLAPFQLEAPTWARLRYALAVRWQDVLLNVALLAPAGFISAMRRRVLGRQRASFVRALATGAALSAGLELMQFFIPMRCPSPIDIGANALGFAAASALHSPLADRAERALLLFVRRPPSLAGIALCSLALAAIALAPLEARALHASFQWTIGPSPLAHGPRAIVIGLVASLGLAGWLGFSLRARAGSALAACAGALPVLATIEVCRGYSGREVASLFTFALAALCALAAAHAAGRVRRVARQRLGRIWV